MHTNTNLYSQTHHISPPVNALGNKFNHFCWGENTGYKAKNENIMTIVNGASVKLMVEPSRVISWLCLLPNSLLAITILRLLDKCHISGLAV